MYALGPYAFESEVHYLLVQVALHRYKYIFHAQVTWKRIWLMWTRVRIWCGMNSKLKPTLSFQLWRMLVNVYINQLTQWQIGSIFNPSVPPFSSPLKSRSTIPIMPVAPVAIPTMIPQNIFHNGGFYCYWNYYWSSNIREI